MDWILDGQIWASFLTLAALEIVLGIDNIIFLSIICERLPENQQKLARRVGLGLALLMRLGLLASVVWIIGLTQPIINVAGFALSWRDLILFGGGLFLLAKGTHEIHRTMEREMEKGGAAPTATFGLVVVQIVVLDLVFSLDSVITAVGMTDIIGVMVAAVIVAIGVMLFAAEPVSAFIERHPTTKMLALSFLLLVGVALIADGLHFHIPRGYLYFAIAFSILVESLNLLAKARRRRPRGPST